MFNYIYMADPINTIQDIQSRIDRYNHQMNNFYTNALDKIGRIKQLVEGIQKLRSDYNNLVRDLGMAEAERDGMKDRIERLGNEIQELQDTNQRLRKEQGANQESLKRIEELNTQNDQLSQERERLERELGISNSNLDVAQTTNKQLEQDKERMTQRIAEQQREEKEKQDLLQQQINKTDEEKRKCEESLRALQNEMENKDKQIDNLRGNATGLQNKLQELTATLATLENDQRTQQIEKGLDEILGALGEDGSSSGSGSPPGPPGPPPAPLSFNTQRSSSADNSYLEEPESSVDPPNNNGEGSLQAGPIEDASLLPDDASVGSVDSENSRTNRFVRKGSHHVKAIGQDNKPIIIKFNDSVHSEDMKARKSEIAKIVNTVYRKLNFQDDQKVIVNNKVDYPHTIRGKASGALNDSEDLKTMRKNVREELMKWQNKYVNNNGEKPFENFYLPKGENNYSTKDGRYDPFDIEFPHYSNKRFKIPEGGVSSKGGKKTRRNKNKKSKDKTIKYKKRMNKRAKKSKK